MELYLGIVNKVKNTKEGMMIDILGIDGLYYEKVEVFNTPGLNEIPVGSDIPERNGALIEELESIFEGGGSGPSIQEILNSKIRTLVLFTKIKSFGDSNTYSIIPIKFLKNYALPSEGSPPKFTKIPQPGEIAVQASGNISDSRPGGYLYLNKIGDVEISTGLARCQLIMNNMSGTIELNSQRLNETINNYNVSIKDGVFKLERKKYLGVGNFANVNDVELTINQLGNVELKIGGPLNTATITISQTGEIKIESKNNITINSVGVLRLNDGLENLIRGKAFMTLYNSHTHIGNLGAPTSIPVTPMTPAQLSTKNYTE